MPFAVVTRWKNCTVMGRTGGAVSRWQRRTTTARLHEVEESALNLYRIDAPVRLGRDPRKIDADDTEIVRLD